MSSNVLIMLSIDVTLSSIVILKDVKNFTIVGHRNPNIYCENTGGLHFISCHECRIGGINWNRCGAVDENDKNLPGLKFENSSNITIRNCSFQQSVGKAVALSQVSGNMIINQCSFLKNANHFDHGAALHFSSKTIKYFPLKLVIANCNFTNHSGQMSIVYIEQNNFLDHTFIIRNTSFIDNKGTAIYLCK